MVLPRKSSCQEQAFRKNPFLNTRRADKSWQKVWSVCMPTVELSPNLFFRIHQQLASGHLSLVQWFICCCIRSAPPVFMVLILINPKETSSITFNLSSNSYPIALKVWSSMAQGYFTNIKASLVKETTASYSTFLSGGGSSIQKSNIIHHKMYFLMQPFQRNHHKRTILKLCFVFVFLPDRTS